MAGIGFALRGMVRRGDLMGVVQAYGLSAMLSAGPWLFTVIAIALITIAGSQLTAWAEILYFRAVITYNFSISLVLSGPIVLVATRFVSDQIYTKDPSRVPGVLVAALALYGGVALLPAALLYGAFADMTALERASAIIGLFLTGFIWVAVLFISALKDFVTVAAVFAAGMAAAVLASVPLAWYWGGAGLVMGFNVGLTVTFFSLMARIFREYPFRINRPWELLGRFRPYWVLAASGLCYNLAIWVDKWLMWWWDPHAETVAGVLKTLPYYDSAMFLAYLITVPGMALFFVSVETEFFELTHRFYGSFAAHATLTQIRGYKEDIAAFVSYSFRTMTIFLACLGVVAILSASLWFETLGIAFNQIGIYRLGVVGAVFHTLVLFELIVFSYFDLRKTVLGINLLFLVANIVLTLVTIHLGFPYYGYGYLAAAALTFFVGLVVLVDRLSWLDYVAFIANNPSVKG